MHRLNRTEYANAIDDLFGLQVDAAALLPRDDESDGFDNAASVLKVSPSFLEQYLAAARVVASMAVGDPAAKLDSRVFYAPANANQNFHVEGMPLGTRGGMRVEHYFPADGEYEFDLGGLARARYVEGLEYRHELILTIDGVKVFENEIGGPEDLADVDLEQASAVAAINSRFENIRRARDGGPARRRRDVRRAHDLGVRCHASTARARRRRSRHHRGRGEPAEDHAARRSMGLSIRAA